ncbi:hypothetical protein ABZZ47_42795, partial [Streptomyces sp. NPDC006465]|uniref:hypothetical protein n=1 Tax=Streptomyces sp. NPDC006465 TaxID=3157174 RepID=UPI00339E15C7
FFFSSRRPGAVPAGTAGRHRRSAPQVGTAGRHRRSAGERPDNSTPSFGERMHKRHKTEGAKDQWN